MHGLYSLLHIYSVDGIKRLEIICPSTIYKIQRCNAQKTNSEKNLSTRLLAFCFFAAHSINLQSQWFSFQKLEMYFKTLCEIRCPQNSDTFCRALGSH